MPIKTVEEILQISSELNELIKLVEELQEAVNFNNFEWYIEGKFSKIYEKISAILNHNKKLLISKNIVITECTACNDEKITKSPEE